MSDRRRRRLEDEGEDETADTSIISTGTDEASPSIRKDKIRASECESEGESGDVELSECDSESAVDEGGDQEETEDGSESETEEGSETEDASDSCTETEGGEDYTDEEGVDGERESGDGEEQPETDKPDDDEDRKNPCYIPRKGAFYEHDFRDGIEGEEEAEPEAPEQAKPKKKLWQDEGKWGHDSYRDDMQAPKTREELIAIYGYDIRAADKPPEVLPRKLRRGGGGGSSRRDAKFQDYLPRMAVIDTTEYGKDSVPDIDEDGFITYDNERSSNQNNSSRPSYSNNRRGGRGGRMPRGGYHAGEDEMNRANNGRPSYQQQRRSDDKNQHQQSRPQSSHDRQMSDDFPTPQEAMRTNSNHQEDAGSGRNRKAVTTAQSQPENRGHSRDATDYEERVNKRFNSRENSSNSNYQDSNRYSRDSNHQQQPENHHQQQPQRYTNRDSNKKESRYRESNQPPDNNRYRDSYQQPRDSRYSNNPESSNHYTSNEDGGGRGGNSFAERNDNRRGGYRGGNNNNTGRGRGSSNYRHQSQDVRLQELEQNEDGWNQREVVYDSNRRSGGGGGGGARYNNNNDGNRGEDNRKNYGRADGYNSSRMHGSREDGSGKNYRGGHDNRGGDYNNKRSSYPSGGGGDAPPNRSGHDDRNNAAKRGGNYRGYEQPPRYQQQQPQPQTNREPREFTNASYRPDDRNAGRGGVQDLNPAGYNSGIGSDSIVTAVIDTNIIQGSDLPGSKAAMSSPNVERKSYAKERRAKGAHHQQQQQQQRVGEVKDGRVKVTGVESPGGMTGHTQQYINATPSVSTETASAQPTSASSGGKRYSSQRQQGLAKGGYSESLPADRGANLYNPALPPPSLYQLDPASASGSGGGSGNSQKPSPAPVAPVVVSDAPHFNPSMLPPGTTALPYHRLPAVPQQGLQMAGAARPPTAVFQAAPPPPPQAPPQAASIAPRPGPALIAPAYIAPTMIYGAPAAPPPRVPPPGTPAGLSLPFAYAAPPPPPNPLAGTVPASSVSQADPVALASGQPAHKPGGQPKKVYRGDITYYAPELQQPSRTPQKRPKSAIPIVDPQEMRRLKELDAAIEREVSEPDSNTIMQQPTAPLSSSNTTNSNNIIPASSTEVTPPLPSSSSSSSSNNNNNNAKTSEITRHSDGGTPEGTSFESLGSAFRPPSPKPQRPQSPRAVDRGVDVAPTGVKEEVEVKKEIDSESIEKVKVENASLSTKPDDRQVAVPVAKSAAGSPDSIKTVPKVEAAATTVVSAEANHHHQRIDSSPSSPSPSSSSSSSIPIDSVKKEVVNVSHEDLPPKDKNSIIAASSSSSSSDVKPAVVSSEGEVDSASKVSSADVNSVGD